MSQKQILIASSNKGKLREFSSMLNALHIEVVSQADLGIGDAVEDGQSFIENAIKKARHACKQSGLSAIADDSGLSVPALNGQPGIHSARFSGEHGNDTANNAKLLAEMQDLAGDKRLAHFHCVLVYMRDAEDPTPLVCHGQWQGRILNTPAGNEGFGYDPLFFVDSENCTAAELSRDKKSQLSHRGQALRELLIKLKAQS